MKLANLVFLYSVDFVQNSIQLVGNLLMQQLIQSDNVPGKIHNLCLINREEMTKPSLLCRLTS